MVGGRRVVVLDDVGRPIRRAASLGRFNSFAEGPCPVLEAFVAATPAGVQFDASSAQPMAHSTPRVKRFGMVNPSANLRPMLRVLSRERDGIVP